MILGKTAHTLATCLSNGQKVYSHLPQWRIDKMVTKNTSTGRERLIRTRLIRSST